MSARRRRPPRRRGRARRRRRLVVCPDEGLPRGLGLRLGLRPCASCVDATWGKYRPRAGNCHSMPLQHALCLSLLGLASPPPRPLGGAHTPQTRVRARGSARKRTRSASVSEKLPPPQWSGAMTARVRRLARIGRTGNRLWPHAYSGARGAVRQSMRIGPRGSTDRARPKRSSLARAFNDLRGCGGRSRCACSTYDTRRDLTRTLASSRFSARASSPRSDAPRFDVVFEPRGPRGRAAASPWRARRSASFHVSNASAVEE